MPRQPYLQVVPNRTPAKYDLGTHSINQRPELEKLIGNCIFAWPFVEAEMAVLLGQLLGAQSAAVQAVFQALRRSSAQRDAISEAAKVVLDERDQELLAALLNIHKSIEADRNALVHGHFGTASSLPDAILWQNTNDYVTFRTEMTLSKDLKWDDARHERLLKSIWVYRKNDLEIILQDIKELAQLWFDITGYFQMADIQPAALRDAEYIRLCGQSRIAQELDNIRRKNSREAPPR